MPGDDRKKIEKAITLGVDCICMDLEDGTAINKKAEARSVIAKAMQELNFGSAERCIRINSAGSGFEEEDIASALEALPDTIVMPKVESADQIAWVCGKISAFEKDRGLAPNSIALLIGIETAKGIINLKEICGADQRLQAIIFGAEDYAASIGATRSRAGWEVLHARSAVVMYAAAFALQAIDMVFIDFKDAINLKIESAQGAAMGFSGKQIIHPSQVNPVQEAFTPDDESIAYARRVIETFEESQREGKGAYALDGKMIDMPLLKAAQGVMARAKAAGKE
jgi:citrate lyase beta subunit